MKLSACAAVLLAAAAVPAVGADLYTARTAYEKKDFATAFEEFRVLAELGHPLAQETVAVMYATGQGVTRDGIRAYAWAQVARENGPSERAKIISDQLQQFITPETRQPVDEIHAAFGKQALEERLLPVTASAKAPAPSGDVPTVATPSQQTCRILRAVSPAKFYPDAALRKGLSGSVWVETPVQLDGRPRNPRVVFSFPPETFDKAGRQAVLNIEFGFDENGKRAPCNVTLVTRFSSPNLQNEREVKAQLVPLKASAEAGDPAAQMQFVVITKGWQALNPTGEDYTWMMVRAAQAGLPAAQYALGFGALNGVWFRKDRAKGIRWLEMATASKQFEARVDLAKALLRDNPGPGSMARSRELLEEAAKNGSKDGRYFLADLLLGDPDPARRDPRRALKILLDDYRLEDPGTFELRAAAYSQTGDFEKAGSNAKTALNMARRLGWDVTPLAERVARYQEKQPWAGLLLTY